MLPNAGNLPPLAMSDINGPSGFNGRGNNLNAYRGTLFYRPNNSTGYFPSGAIAFTDFYATQATSPVVPGSATYTSGSSITLPTLFNTLTVTCYGGSGGGGGGSWLAGTDVTKGGGSGGAGGATYFANGQSYAVSASGGGAGGGAAYTYQNQFLSGGVWYNVGGPVDGTGSTGADGSGADGGSPSIGGGGSGSGDGASHIYYTSGTTRTIYAAASGGSGGKGGKSSILVFSIASQGWAYVSQFYSASIPVTFGAGGAAGGGGGGYSGLSGGAGAGGKIILSWT